MLKLWKKYNQNILKYLVAAIIFAIPLYPKFPFITVPGTFVSIRLEDFLIFIVAAFWFLTITPKLKNLLSQKITKLVVLFLCVALLSVISAIFITKTAVPHIAILHWLRRIEYMLPLFIGMSVIRSQKDLAFFMKCFLLVILYMFFYGIGQKYFGLPVITTQNYEYSKGVALRYTQGGHLTSTFAGHYDLASFLVFLLPFFFSILFSGSINKLFSRNDRLRNIYILFWFLAIISGFWMLINSVSRISIVTYILAVTVTLFLIRRYKVIPFFIILSIVFISVSSNLVSRYTSIFEVTIQKILNPPKTSVIFLPEAYAASVSGGLPQRKIPEELPTPPPQPVFEDRSTSIRLNVEWPRAIRAFKKNPPLGTGFSSITLATDNDYLRLLGETGILGLTSFLLILFYLFKKVFKQCPLPKNIDLSSAFVAGFIGGFAGILLNAVFIDIFEASKFAIIFWLFVGFFLKIAHENEYEQ